MRIKLTVAYDGTNYSGWQIQPEDTTIELMLNKAISDLYREDIKVTGASRTDAGVHAMGNVAVFDAPESIQIPPERIAYALNVRLPEDIVVVKSEAVAEDFHPRHCDTRKTYEYSILNQDFPDPKRRLYSHYYRKTLDVEKMRRAAQYLVGEHDFKSFCSVKTQTETTVRRIYSIEVLQEGSLITIRVQGNGFLYNMVRIIAGTLIEVGNGHFTPETVKEMLECRDRTVSGPTAPPNGLTLVGIEYVQE